MRDAMGVFEELDIDEKRIVDLLQKRGPLSKNELQLMTKMKLTTLNRITAPLEQANIMIESGVGASRGGRRPALYDINPNLYYVVGIDISRIYTQVVITNLKMEVLYQDSFLMLDQFSPGKTVQTISQLVHTGLDKLSLTKDRIIGVGLGIVGPLDRQKGRILNPIHFSNVTWNNTPIKQQLEEALGLLVIIDNGANTAVLAEYLYGAGKNSTNIAYVNCSIGIRTGVISSGHIIRTINDAEDAFGHMVIDVDGESCQCGNYGCIECYSSIPAIVKNFTSSAKKGRITLIHKPLDQIDYIDICNAAEKGDDLAREVILSAATILGVGLVNYINLLNPNVLILGGLLIKHSPLFYNTCIDTIQKKNYLRGSEKVTFIKEGVFGDHGMVLGAAALVIEEALGNISAN